MCSLTGKRGVEILQDPRINKGTAFTTAERDRLGLRGLTPPRTTDVEEQEYRVLRAYRRNTTDLSKYIYLTSL
jgi:malate dehydrogenase (oxaloacetate-decarboxylating)(NADP+)